jgi:hypothetical protein
VSIAALTSSFYANTTAWLLFAERVALGEEGVDVVLQPLKHLVDRLLGLGRDQLLAAVRASAAAGIGTARVPESTHDGEGTPGELDRSSSVCGRARAVPRLRRQGPPRRA